jgi:hypothetical protein
MVTNRYAGCAGIAVVGLVLVCPNKMAPHCSASVSNAHPRQNAAVRVNVSTRARASVETVAYVGADSIHRTTVANRRGKAHISYRIRRAARGYTVRVEVTVARNGKHGVCRTAFTPR